MLKLISWNIAHRQKAWHSLLDTDADVALLQEAAEPPADVRSRIEVNPAPWVTGGAGLNRPWRTAIAKLSNQVKVEWVDQKSVDVAKPGELAVSRAGTITVAILQLPSGDPLTVVSMYAVWENPHVSTGSNWIYADASVHRLISDLSSLIGQQTGHRIVAAGDLNVLYGYGEYGNSYWASRYETVFSRMSALGLSFVGPQAPAGRCADPWPEELPRMSKNVPTYHTNRQTPATATRQLDFVFASYDLVDQVNVSALNEPDGWGPSDHCQVEIQVQ